MDENIVEWFTVFLKQSGLTTQQQATQKLKFIHLELGSNHHSEV